jgi:hypothetical protein
VDFGVNVADTDAALYEMPFEHVVTHVKPMREASRSQVRDSRWWLTLWPRPEMRAAISVQSRYLATPTVSKHRLFSWIDTSVLPNHQVVVFAREDDYFFGVLHSRAHEVWSLRMGTSLEDRPRYIPTTCFETFPLPWPPGCEPVDDPRVIAIGKAARALNELRENWLNPEGASDADLKKRTLTNLYNARPHWLSHAHAALDRAVWAAYGWDDPDPRRMHVTPVSRPEQRSLDTVRGTPCRSRARDDGRRCGTEPGAGGGHVGGSLPIMLQPTRLAPAL